MDILKNWKKLLTILVVTTIVTVCVPLVTSKKCPLPEAVRFRMLIVEKAELHLVDPALIAAIIHAESNFNPNAKSYANAKGLMQINPITQRHLGLKNPFNPKENVDAGTRYLSQLLKKFNGNLKHAIAAYNAGPGAVSKYKGIPPYKETRKYVKKVLKYYGEYRSATSEIATIISWLDFTNSNQGA